MPDVSTVRTPAHQRHRSNGCILAHASVGNGRSKILAIIDYFSRCIWTFASPQHRARDVVKVWQELRDTLAALAARIITDGAWHLDCAQVSQLLESNEVEHRIVSAYAPWVNGLVERHNGLLIQTVQKLATPPITKSAPASASLAWQP